MNNIKKLKHAFLIGILCLTPSLAHSQSANETTTEVSFCAQATDTAQTIACLSKELDFRQTELNNKFIELQKSHESEGATSLTEVQSKWLAYRDAECSREKSWRSGEALSRAYELSCLSQLTQARLQRLNKELDAKDNSTYPEFTPTARWQTIIINEYPATFWNFSKSFAIDSNCDNIKDNITPGVKLMNSDEAYVKRAVFAIAHLKETGRPEIHLFENDEIGEECLASYVITSHKTEGEFCKLHITFDNPECQALHLQWSETESLYKNIVEAPNAPMLEEENNL